MKPVFVMDFPALLIRDVEHVDHLVKVCADLGKRNRKAYLE